MMIYVARILYPVKVLGPGNRVGIWLAGCDHKCPGCSNPELWEQKDEWKIDIHVLVRIILDLARVKSVDGITVTGGDPFRQPEALDELLGFLKDITDDILVYTGYDYDYLKKTFPETLKSIGVLIDGLYLKDRNKGQRLVGSDNQRIIYLKECLRGKYEEFLSGNHPDIQNFSEGNSIVSVGIHLPGYNEEIKRKAKEKGLIDNG